MSEYLVWNGSDSIPRYIADGPSPPPGLIGKWEDSYEWVTIESARTFDQKKADEVAKEVRGIRIPKPAKKEPKS